MNTPQEYYKYLVHLEKERQQWDNRNRDIAKYIVPGRGRFTVDNTTPNEGDDKNKDILNEVGVYAIRIPVAGMVTGLSNPASEWFQFTFADKDLMKFQPVKEYLDDLRRGFRLLLHKTNFYASLYELYEEEIGFGTGVQIVDEDPDTLFRCNTLTAGEYVLSNDKNDLSNVMGRRIWMTAWQMKERFEEDTLSLTVKNALKENLFSWFQVINFIEENQKRDSSKIDNRNFPWSSVYFELGQGTPGEAKPNFLLKTGYKERALFAPKWKRTAEDAYGRGLGNDTIGSVKGIQSMEEESYNALYKTVDPPLIGLKNFTRFLNTEAGGVNVADNINEMEGLKSLYTLNFNIEGVEAKIDRVSGQVGRGFFNDLFLFMQSNPNATATEILEKKAEKVILLGPVITRQQTSYFDPFFERIFAIAMRNNYFGPPPPELADKELEIEYVSQLAIAQRLAGMDGIYGYVNLAGQLQGLDPQHPAIDNIDFDNTMKAGAEKLGVPPNMQNSDDEILAIRESKAEAAEAQAQAEQAQAMVDGAEKLSKTSLEGKNALTELTGANE